MRLTKKLTGRIVPLLAFRAATALTLVFLFSGLATAADVVAMVTDVQGKVALATARGRPPVSILSELTAGTELVLGKDAVITIVYIDSGDEFRMTGPASVSIAVSTPRLTGAGTLVKRPTFLAGQAAKLEVTDGRVIQAAIVLRGGGAQPPVQISPKEKILDTRPVFRWIPVGSYEKNQFELYDEETGKVIIETQVAGTSFELPADVFLTPGNTYSWSIAPVSADNDGEMKTARFTLATDEESRRFSRPANEASFSERLIYAALLEQEGFRSEAAAMWKVLSAERPTVKALRELAAR